MMGSPNILELLSAPKRVSDQVKFVTPRGEQETCFADLWSLACRTAQTLDASVTPRRVAVLLTPSAPMVASFVGCLEAGRDVVSLPLPGRGQSGVAYAQQLDRIVECSEVGAILVESAYRELIQSLPIPLKVPVILAEDLVEGRQGHSHKNNNPGEIIQFSSGTTGSPKGVRLSGAAVAACVEALISALGIGSTPEVFCGWVPLSHDMGLIGGLLATWVAATRTAYRYICISPELFVARPSIWLESCAATHATITTGPTFAYQIASKQIGRGPKLDLSALRAAIVGAEPIGADALRAFESAAIRHGLRETTLCPAYGLAEATLAVSMVSPEERWTTQAVSVDGQTSDYVSCGRPLEGVRVEAPPLDAGAGPIRVAGPVVCSGYIPPRAGAGDGWLDTGDLGVLADRELLVTGRSDDLLCVAGRKLFAWELERAASSLPWVRAGNCAVVTDGRGRYVALVEAQESARDEWTGALSEVRRQLAAVAGVGPSAVGCLPRGALPKTPSGKMQRNGIAADLNRFITSCLAYREF